MLVSAVILHVMFAVLSTSLKVSSLQNNHDHGNLSCAPYETPCTFGCCPYAEATCCADGFECCQHGQTCIPIVGICIGLVSEDDKEPSLMSTKATPIRNMVTACPSGTTECENHTCCLLPNAVCCSDGKHCCPAGYRCDLAHEMCVKDNNEVNAPFLSSNAKQYKTVNKPAYKSCPGGNHQCPSYASCCLNDSGNWGCCPNPASNLYREGDGECCTTMFGPMCCPDDFPVCTFFGCTNS